MMRMLRKYIVLLILSGTLAGCAKDADWGRADQGDQRPVTLFVMSPATRDGQSADSNAVEEDNEIVDFRVMVFESGGGKLIENRYVPNIWAIDPENLIELKIYTGVYDFLFIANEKAEAATSDLHSRLAGYDPRGAQKYYLSDALGESVPYTDFDAARPIPMSALYCNVSVTDDRTIAYTEEGAARQITDAVWPVLVHRLGIRLDLTIATDIDELKDNITGLTFRIPRKVYLVNDRSGSAYAYPNNTGTLAEATTELTIAYDNGNGILENPSGDGINYEWTLPRIVLPENTFNPLSDETRVLRVGAHFSGSISSLYGSLTFDRTDGDLTAPRNYIYRMTGVLSDVIRFDGTVAAWGEHEQTEIDLSDVTKKLEPEANCYVVKPNSNPIAIPVKRLLDPRLSGYIHSSYLIHNMSGWTAGILWSDTRGTGQGKGEGAAVRAARFVNKGTINKSYILLTPGDVEGNSVVYLYYDNNRNSIFDDVGDVILYSWHIWVSNDKDEILSGVEGIHATSGEQLYWMDRNLGAKYNEYRPDDEAGVMGLQYQWGRKDPFPGAAGFSGTNSTTTKPVYGVQAPLLPYEGEEVILPNGDLNPEIHFHDLATMAEAIQNPAYFYCSLETGEWRRDSPSPSGLWNDPTIDEAGKSIFDPCPAGWKVPVYGMPHQVTGVNLWNGASLVGSYGVRNDFYGGYYPCVFVRPYGTLINDVGVEGIKAGIYWMATGHDTQHDFGKEFIVFNPNPFQDWEPDEAVVGYGQYEKSFGASVRCVKE